MLHHLFFVVLHPFLPFPYNFFALFILSLCLSLITFSFYIIYDHPSFCLLYPFLLSGLSFLVFLTPFVALIFFPLVGAFLIDLLTRFAWDEAGLEPTAARYGGIHAPTVPRTLMESMAPRLRLGQIFRLENQCKLTATAAPLIRRAFFDVGNHHDQHALRAWPLAELSMAPNSSNRNITENIDVVVATLS